MNYEALQKAILPVVEMAGWPRTGAIEILVSDRSPTADFILAKLRRTPLRFIYTGGTRSGVVRRVRVEEVFKYSDSDLVYAKGYCYRAKEERIFRLDRVRLDLRSELRGTVK